jgi:biopolymer transport protein ExbD
VFLLLIFFILASTLVTSSALDVILPKSGAQTVKKKNITLTVNADLEFDINGKIVSYEEVERTLVAAANSLASDEQAVVVLRADQSIPTGETVRILDIGYRNNMRMIIATDPN